MESIIIYCTVEFETVSLPVTLCFQLLYVSWPYFKEEKMGVKVNFFMQTFSN